MERVRALEPFPPALQEEVNRWAATVREERQRQELLSGPEPKEPDRWLLLAEALYGRSHHAKSVAAYRKAFVSQEIRADFERLNLYNAACAAALAAGGSPPSSREQADFHAQALAWLKGDLAYHYRRRAELKEALEAKPSAEELAALRVQLEDVDRHLSHARVRDPDWASFRSSADFRRLFQKDEDSSQ